jgi:hypothetical protein
VVGEGADWAHEIRRQLISEIEQVGSGLADGGQLLHQDTPAEASDRIVDLRRRLGQVERLIEAIDALRDGAEEDALEEDGGDPVMPDNAAMDRNGRGRGNSFAD